MVGFIRKLYERYKNILLYILFGMLTTAVNYIVYYPLYNFADMSGAASNIIAWFCAVIFAFLTNKPIVFASRDWKLKTVLSELWKFLACRIASGATETLIIYLAVDVAQCNGNIVKLAVSILVVILNYFASKLFVFNKNQGR